MAAAWVGVINALLVASHIPISLPSPGDLQPLFTEPDSREAAPPQGRFKDAVTDDPCWR